MTYEAWFAEGKMLFGDDTNKWRFVCPSCGHVATPEDWLKARAPETVIAFSCVGRWDGTDPKKAAEAAFKNKGGPCNYAGGGLFTLNPVEVDGLKVFAFAEN